MSVRYGGLLGYMGTSEQLLQCSDCVALDAKRFLPHFGVIEGRLGYFAVGMPS
jgi:hypothetical protein